MRAIIETQIENFESEDVGPLMGMAVPPRPVGAVPKGKMLKTIHVVFASSSGETDIYSKIDAPTSTLYGGLPPFELGVSPLHIGNPQPYPTMYPIYVTIAPPADTVEGHYNYSCQSCTGAGGFGLCVKSNQSFDVVPTRDISLFRIVQGQYDAAGTPKTTPKFPEKVDEGIRSPFGECIIHNATDSDGEIIQLSFQDLDTGEIIPVTPTFTTNAWQSLSLSFAGTFYGTGIKHWQLQTRSGNINNPVLDTYNFTFELTNPQFGYLECHAYVNEKEMIVPVTITPGDQLINTPFWTPMTPGDYHLKATMGTTKLEKDITIELSKQVNVNFQFGTTPPPKGSLQVKAFEDSTELQIPVTITPSDQTFTTPFKTDLDPGAYHLKADYNGNIKEQDATVESGKQTDVVFNYGVVPPPPPTKLLNVALPMITGISLMTIGEKAFKDRSLKLFKK